MQSHAKVSAGRGRPLLAPAVRQTHLRVEITIDGAPAEGWAGQSVLAAVLLAGNKLNTNEASGEPRAGFCLMGVCQDCWVWLGDGTRVRACTTPIADGMAILTEPPSGMQHDG